MWELLSKQRTNRLSVTESSNDSLSTQARLPTHKMSMNLLLALVGLFVHLGYGKSIRVGILSLIGRIGVVARRNMAWGLVLDTDERLEVCGPDGVSMSVDRLL